MRPSRGPLLLAGALLVVALGVLVWLRQRIVGEELAVLNDAVRLLERSDVLRRPENDSVRFAEIESIARTLGERDLVDDLTIVKISAGTGRDVAVYPWWRDLAEPDWRERFDRVLPVTSAGEIVGSLHVRIDPAPRRLLDAVIGLFAAFLLACLVVIVRRQRGQDVALGRVRSELEQRNAEIIRLERLALAGRLSANILHDLRKPVLNIRHEVTDALEDGAAETRNAELLQLLLSQTDLFLQLLRDLGFEQFVRVEAEEPEYCDLTDVIRRSLALVKYERESVELDDIVAPPDGVPFVLARPHHLIQLFSNLILNACQAMEGRGRLRITLIAEKQSVVVTVEDSGPGVDPAVAHRIFEPFATTKAETGGSGLGLYIGARIVEDLGGSVSVERSADLGGALFRVVLPAAADQSPARSDS